MKYKTIKQNAGLSTGILGILLNPHYFVCKHLTKSVKKHAPILEGKLLDFGCGAKPYKSYFCNVQEYIGLDYENEGHNHADEIIDVFYNGKDIPFENDTFDSILCTEVFEHVENIELNINELYRVLKKGGKILLTTPFFFPEHELPHDYRRLTYNGLSSFLEQHGFEVLSTQKNGHFQEVIWQLRVIYIRDLIRLKNKYLNFIFRSMIVPPMIILGIIWSAILPKQKSVYFNTVILVVKTEFLN